MSEVRSICSNFFNLVDQISVSESPMMINKQPIFRKMPSTKEDLENKMTEHSPRVNFLIDGENDISELELPDSAYAWLVVVRSQKKLHINYPSSIPNTLLDKGIVVDTCLSISDRNTLLDLWIQDYHMDILSCRSEDFKNRDLVGLEKRMQNGSNFIYKKEGKIVSHFLISDSQHPVLGFKSNYWHQWIDKTLDPKLRKIIHKHSFGILDSLDKPAMSGIFIKNKQGIKHAVRNGASPILLSIKG